jgi:MerR family transcriptional regulator, copper efflux regulator
MRIGTLARSVGVSVDAIRIYEARGLIRSDRRSNGYRDFPEVTVEQVRLIRLGQSLGFSLAEIGDVLRGVTGSLPAEEVRALLAERVSAVDNRIANLTELRGLLSARMEAACPLVLTVSGK